MYEWFDLFFIGYDVEYLTFFVLILGGLGDLADLDDFFSANLSESVF